MSVSSIEALRFFFLLRIIFNVFEMFLQALIAECLMFVAACVHVLVLLFNKKLILFFKKFFFLIFWYAVFLIIFLAHDLLCIWSRIIKNKHCLSWNSVQNNNRTWRTLFFNASFNCFSLFFFVCLFVFLFYFLRIFIFLLA